MEGGIPYLNKGNHFVANSFDELKIIMSEKKNSKKLHQNSSPVLRQFISIRALQIASLRKAT